MTEEAIVSPDKLWSSMAPRYLTDAVDWIKVLLHDIFNTLSDFNLVFEANKIDSVFPR